MPTPGKRLIAAFVAGTLAAALLLALPFYTIRERVIDLEDEQDALAREANATVAQRLIAAADAVEAWPGGDRLADARAEAAGAATAAELHPTARDGDPALAEAAREASGALGAAARADACGMLTARSPAGSALSDLAVALRATGQALQAGQPAPAEELTAAAGAARERIETALAGHARVEDVRLQAHAARAEVRLAGPPPDASCPGELAVEACAAPAGAPACRATNASGEAPTREDGWLSVPVEGTVDGPATVHVRVESQAAGVNSTDAASAGAPAWPVEVEPVARGWDSDVNASRLEVVETEAAWERLWDDHAEASDAPAVDFDARVAVAAFAGQRPTGCHGVHLEAVTVQANGTVRVEAPHLESAPVRCTDEPTTPYAIGTLPAPEGPVTVQAVRR